MSRKTRKSYPVEVQYILRLNRKKLKAETDIPLSLITKLRKGSIKVPSAKTIEKFNVYYETYWKSRLSKKGARTDEIKNWLDSPKKSTPDYLQTKEKELYEVARKISFARNMRDGNEPDGEKNSIADVLKQMADNTGFTASDWIVYVQKVTIGGYYKPSHIADRKEKHNYYKRKANRAARKAKRELYNRKHTT